MPDEKLHSNEERQLMISQFHGVLPLNGGRGGGGGGMVYSGNYVHSVKDGSTYFVFGIV
jgi:hypothetical protein